MKVCQCGCNLIGYFTHFALVVGTSVYYALLMFIRRMMYTFFFEIKERHNLIYRRMKEEVASSDSGYFGNHLNELKFISGVKKSWIDSFHCREKRREGNL
mmetsp:Transcript_11391/g.25102  ORF Transcript_11391/g.25102 Transcript_11391/m.25102 type:complete len:100 (-) Transcript_11391:725-1024(-)